MNSLHRTDWSLGWTPNANEIGGDPRGLLRMDNLCLDEDGVVVKARSNRVVSPQFSGKIHSIYSNNVRSTKYRFVGLSDGTVRYSSDEVTWNTLFDSGDNASAAFGSGLGHIYACSGSVRKKFDGTTVSDITPREPANPPTVQEAAKNDFVVYNNDYTKFTVIKGTLTEGAPTPTFTTDTNEGIVELAGPWDMTVYPLTGTQYQVDDVFWLQLLFADADYVKKITVIFNMDSSYDPTSNYFKYSWVRDDLVSKDSWTTLKAVRTDFEKVAVDSNKGWDDIVSMRLIVETTGEVQYKINENGILFVGSNENPLTGYYEYCQVNVNNTGAYFASSLRGPESTFVQLINGRAIVTPDIADLDPQVNEIWIYRRSATYVSDVVERGEPPQLDQWYKIKTLDSTTGFGAFEDGVSDIEAILGNSTYKEGTESISRWTDQLIYGIAGPFGGRFLYMGDKDIYISLRFDPGRYHPRQSIKLSGELTERNLWIRKLNEQTCLVGTTEDIYEITGTMADLPNGGIDMRVNNLGVGKPPIAKSVAVENRNIFYVQARGISTLSEDVTVGINNLFNGINCHGIDPVAVVPGGYGDYALAIGNNKLYYSAQLINGNRVTFVRDLAKGYWYMRTDGAYNFFTEEDGIVIGGFSDGYLREIETRDDSLPIYLKTTYDDNQQPNNRKESFTFRINVHSPNTAISVVVKNDADGETEVLNATLHENFNEGTTTSIEEFSKCHKYQLILSGTTDIFKLHDYTIYYEALPEPLAYLKLKYNNYESAAPKRIATQPFVIDTLGNTIEIVPSIDQVAKTALQFNTTDKRTVLYYYTAETEGIDWEYEIRALSGRFEFYSMMNPEILEVLPVAKKYDQVGPIEFNRVGTLMGMRIRMRVNIGANPSVIVPVKIYAQDELEYEYNITVDKATDQVFEKMRFPQTKHATVAKAIIGPTTPEVTFHRYWVEWLVNIGGGPENSEIVRVK